MSRRIEKCHICKGAGLIIVDDWLTKGMTEEQIAKKKEEALADIVEVVRCKDCKQAKAEVAKQIFEEIGKILYKHTKNAIKEKSVTCELTIDYIGEDIAELKKKYTQN